MGGQGVARQDGVDIAVLHQLGKGVPGVIVKGKGGAHDPDDLAVIPVVPEEVVDFIIVLGEGSLPGPVLPEGEHIPLGSGLPEAVGVDVNAVLAVLRPAGEYQLPGLQEAELLDVNDAVLVDRDAVHPALLGHNPLAVHLEILGENAHGMVVHGGHTVLGAGLQNRVGGVAELLLIKIRGREGSQGKAHKNRSFINIVYAPAYFSCILS